MQLQNLLPHFKTNSFVYSTVFISVSLIVYPATVLLIPKVNGLIFSLFALIGLFFLFVRRQVSLQVNRNEAQLFVSVSMYFIVSFFITVIGGFEYKAIGKYLHLILLIPIYIYLRHSGIKLFYIWYGLAFGAIVAAGIAIYDVYILNLSAAKGLTHKIVFGDLALVMGCISMAGIGWFKQRAYWWMLLPVIALLCGIFASVLSASRGGWIAVPFLLFVFFWYMPSCISNGKKIIIGVVVIACLAAIYTVPQTKVRFQIDRTINSLQQYTNSKIKSSNRSTSVGTRLEMWQASWKIFLDHPIMGIGWGHYQEQAKLQVDQGLRNKSAARFDHPHSEYFSALAHAGIIGFSVLMLLFLIPARIFIKYIKQGKAADTQRLALAGLVLIVAYMAFGLSEPMLYRSRSVNFFAFYLAVFMAAIYGQENKRSHKSQVTSHKSQVTSHKSQV
jgi:O-antigen ligase